MVDRARLVKEFADEAVVRELTGRLIDVVNDYLDRHDGVRPVNLLMAAHNLYKSVLLSIEGDGAAQPSELRKSAVLTLALGLGLKVTVP